VSMASRKKELFDDFSTAVGWLRRALDLVEKASGDDAWLKRAGVVQVFEFTFELGWKSLKLLLNEKGIEAVGPRDTLREAHAAGILQDGQVWIDALDDRNLSTHAYEEETILAIVVKVQNSYAGAFEETARTLKEKYE
jgi:nucleotidyltransferase substrate binding protein (TIGR01987 family)